MLWLLLACACPTFDEMEVTDRTGTADPELMADLEDGLADFARWTGREGVCVPEIAVVEDPERAVDPDAGYGGGGWSPISRETAEHFGSVGGHYRGDRKAIFIAAEAADPHGVAVHELCHAIDHREDHSKRRPDLFPPLDWEEYPTRNRRSRVMEAFADVCEAGAMETTLLDEVDAACGTQRVSAQYRYVLDEVYSDREAVTTGAADLSWQVASTLADVPVGTYIYGLLELDGQLALLGDWSDPTADGMRMGVLPLDPATGQVGPSIPLRDHGVGGALVADGDRLLALLDDGYPGQQLWSIDLATGAAAVLAEDLGVDRVVSAAVSGDVLYALATRMDGTGAPELLAWDLATLEPVEVGQPDIGTGEAMLATEGGVELLGHDGIARYDAASAAWQTLGRAANTVGWYALAGGARLSFTSNAAREAVPVRWSPDDDTWALAADPCATGLRGRVSAAGQEVLWSFDTQFVEVDEPIALTALRLD